MSLFIDLTVCLAVDGNPTYSQSAFSNLVTSKTTTLTHKVLNIDNHYPNSMMSNMRRELSWMRMSSGHSVVPLPKNEHVELSISHPNSEPLGRDVMGITLASSNR